MSKFSKLFIAAAVLLIIAAVVMRLTMTSVVIHELPIKASSVLVLVNTSLLIALLLKK